MRITSLSTSPTATKDTGNSAAKEPADAKVSESALNPDYPVADPKDKDAALATADAYPRPQNGAAAGQEGGGEVHKDDAKKEEQPPKKEAKKQVFEDSKHAHINKNPHSVKNVPIKQPGGKM